MTAKHIRPTSSSQQLTEHFLTPSDRELDNLREKGSYKLKLETKQNVIERSILKLAGGYTNLNGVIIQRCSSFKYFHQPKIRI